MKKATINGFECRYEISGNVNAAEPIIFLNGIASSLETWAALGDFFKDDYKLLAYDYRGQWFSEITPPPYIFDMMAQDLYELMKTNGMSRAHFVAHSLGGEVGMTFAVEYPDLCQSLTLMTTASEIQPVLYYQVLRWKMAAIEAMALFDQVGEASSEITKEIGNRFFHYLLPEVYSNNFIKNKQDIFEARRKIFETLAHRNFYQGFVYLCDMFFNLLDKEKLTEVIHDISCPTLVIAGGQDILKCPPYSEVIVNHIPNSEYVLSPDAGHGVPLEKCEIVGHLLKGFIKRNHF